MRGVLLVYSVYSLYSTLVMGAVKFNQYDKQKLHKYREEVRAMFGHAYDSYLNHAYPYDELRPLSCDGVDTWGSYSLTLIDALDTLAVMGNYTEFARVYNIVSARENFDANINVSVFETNIRIVGGLISAHLMAKRAGVPLEPGWPCSGPLLRLAEDAVERLLPAFDTPTGMPYGTVNLRHGVPEGETPVTCTAGVGTFVVEFGALSRLTGNPVYEEVALRAMRALWHSRSPIGLLGNHIDVLKGKWTAVEAGIGAGVDSYFEYLVKGSSLLGRPELLFMFNKGREAVDQYLRKDDWYFWVNMKNGQVTLPLFQSLEAFWPGVLSMVGDLEPALKSLHNYHQVWKQYGFTPEFYNVAQGGVSANREGYPLRPELIESIMYLYRATGDPWLVDAGIDILKSIQHSAYTPCGYATVKNVRTHTLEDRMESFFLAETVKYLYLLFDPDNFIHNSGTTATVHETEHGKCVLDAGGYIFNTEAHPIDPAALACCSELSESEIKREISNHLVDILNPTKIKQFRGDLVPERILELEEQRRLQRQQRRQKEAELRHQLELLRKEAKEEAARAKEQQENRSQEAGANQQEGGEPEGEESQSSNPDNHYPPGAATQNNSESGELTSDNSAVHQETDGWTQLPANSEAVTDEENHKNIAGEENFSQNIAAEDISRQNMASEDISRQNMDALDGAANESPQFSREKDSQAKNVVAEPGSGMIQQLSTGDFQQQTGIVQPEAMPNTLLKPTNKLVEAINSLVERFLPAASREFNLDQFYNKMKTDDSWSLNSSWYTDYSILSCPAQKYTDRFLIHGEFFEN